VISLEERTERFKVKCIRRRLAEPHLPEALFLLAKICALSMIISESEF
jgi:hypothetical protein